MKIRRWWLIVGWFVALYLWQLRGVHVVFPEASIAYIALATLGRLTAPVNILLSAAIIILIVKWKWRRQLGPNVAEEEPNDKATEPRGGG
jgi:hypothetical protein